MEPTSESTVDFLGVLTTLDSGMLIEKGDVILQRLIEHVEQTHQGGEITVVVTASWLDGEEAVMLRPTLKTNLKPAKLRPRMFYIGDGHLYRRNPRQAMLPFRVVETTEAPARTIDRTPVAGREIS